VDNIEFFGNIPPKCFLRFAVTLLARSKKLDMSATTAVLYPFPAMSKLLLVGKWFSDGFFGDLHRHFSSSHLARAPPPTLQPKNCAGWLLHARGAPTTKISSGDEIAKPLASFQLGSIITGFPRGLTPTWAKKGQKSSTALSLRCTPAPQPPLVM